MTTLAQTRPDTFSDAMLERCGAPDSPLTIALLTALAGRGVDHARWLDPDAFAVREPIPRDRFTLYSTPVHLHDYDDAPTRYLHVLRSGYYAGIVIADVEYPNYAPNDDDGCLYSATPVLNSAEAADYIRCSLATHLATAVQSALNATLSTACFLDDPDGGFGLPLTGYSAPPRLSDEQQSAITALLDRTLSEHSAALRAPTARP